MLNRRLRGGSSHLCGSAVTHLAWENQGPGWWSPSSCLPVWTWKLEFHTSFGGREVEARQTAEVGCPGLLVGEILELALSIPAPD